VSLTSPPCAACLSRTWADPIELVLLPRSPPSRSIAVDHLSDMATRSLGSSIVTTSGGYKSMELVDYDSTDTNQQWQITSA